MLVAPDSFGGTLTPREAAGAIARGWSSARPDDELTIQPLSDGGEGLLDALGPAAGIHRQLEVSGPLGLPVMAHWAQGPTGTAMVESSMACGLARLEPERRDPLVTTTWGVGELLTAARGAGASHLVVGLGGSATVDGGAGALTALGFRARVADGSGLKVGGRDMHRVHRVDPGWADDWSELDVELLADVSTRLGDAAELFGPQKGADGLAVAHLARGLSTWADVVESAFSCPGLRDEPGTGAAGGLAFGLAAALGGRIRSGATAVAELVGVDALLADIDLVVSGEGALDATSGEGKVLGELIRRSGRANVVAVCGQVNASLDGLADVEASAPNGPGADPAAEVTAAARRLAARI